MLFALILILTFLSGCAETRLDKAIDPESRMNQTIHQPDTSWTERRKALYEQAHEGLQQSRERYIATTRPLLQRKFQQDYPAMTDSEIEALVTQALENGFHSEAGRRPDGPVRLPSMDCMSVSGGRPPYTNCY